MTGHMLVQVCPFIFEYTTTIEWSVVVSRGVILMINYDGLNGPGQEVLDESNLADYMDALDEDAPELPDVSEYRGEDYGDDDLPF
jgi:hypothetical protein